MRASAAAAAMSGESRRRSERGGRVRLEKDARGRRPSSEPVRPRTMSTAAFFSWGEGEERNPRSSSSSVAIREHDGMREEEKAARRGEIATSRSKEVAQGEGDGIICRINCKNVLRCYFSQSLLAKYPDSRKSIEPGCGGFTVHASYNYRDKS